MSSLYWHGSSASRMLRSQSAGIPVCSSVMIVDGLVLARSDFHPGQLPLGDGLRSRGEDRGWPRGANSQRESKWILQHSNGFLTFART
jgi:hypothetical protein